MNLAFLSCSDAGNPTKERVILKATGETQLGLYTALVSQSGEPGVASAGANLAYWFPDENTLKEGDLVILYTKAGRDSKKDLGGGKTAYFYYWGLTSPIWESGRNALVLLESDEYDISFPQDFVEPPSGDATPS